MKTCSLILVSSWIILFSCRKENFISSPDARVTITADTLKFDTVFVTAGSVSQIFKIINDNKQKLRISSVKVMGGSSSAYKINVDGTAGPEVNNLELEANDSLYVFVQVNINPGANNLPFIVRDSILVSINGKNRFVQLEAWGQNAHFYRDKIIHIDETWNNDLPYVILGSLMVNTGATLTINKGCRIYAHADAPIIVEGTLLVNGEKDTADRVYFSGDRLDEPYKDFPASWPGIYFMSSSQDNVLNYAVIKNAYQAIAAQDPAPNANPKVTMNECIVDNAYDAGIIAINTSIRARNCLISNCGKNVVLVKGGDYQFIHCTVVSYSNSFIFHKNPVLLVSNFINVNNVPVTADLNAVFRNCIFWGDGGIVESEVVVLKNGNTMFNVNFDHALWKVQTTPFDIISTQIIANQNPQFDSVNVQRRFFDFRLKDSSPAIDKGANASVIIDLNGNPRPVGFPDLGCFEKQ
jgi:hypothetical protein